MGVGALFLVIEAIAQLEIWKCIPKWKPRKEYKGSNKSIATSLIWPANLLCYHEEYNDGWAGHVED
ncbi:hypothetical protein BGZ60DRAFT_554501 [Tricladium varicosporioides]|nr:hypothetical protein BGZ60DRAFT_554501 [Hymenoscyphus varicosporioides]